MVLIYAYTFYKAWTGTRYKVVLGLVVMLILSNVGWLLWGTALNEASKASTEDGEKKLLWMDVAAVGEAIGDILSSEAHWILAVYYLKIAQNMPKIIAGQFDQVKTYKAIFWIGVVLNMLFPLMEAVGYFMADFEDWVNATGKSDGFWIVNIAASGHGILWMSSGFVLVWSIFSIRNYLKERNDDGRALNIKTLVLHSSAFGLFAIAMILNEVAIIYLSIVSFTQQSDQQAKDRA